MNQTIQQIRNELQGVYPPQEIEQFIQIIFNHLLGYSRVDIILNKSTKIIEPLRAQVEQIILRLKRHEPIQYILGETHFLDYTFHVRSGVLIPRPETEELIEQIIHENPHHEGSILDIGTGSGCIAISLALLLPQSKVTAWEISSEALTIAQENAQLNQASVQFCHHDVFDTPPANQKFSIIVSNPPYVCDNEKTDMEPNVLLHEPHLALFVPDSDPLRYYRRIAQLALDMLQPQGKLYFEINAQFGEETLDMLRQLGYTHVELFKDLSGKARITRAIHP